MNSVEQDEWRDIAAAAREQLRCRVGEMKTIPVADLDKFVDSLWGIAQFEVYAATWDDHVEITRRKARGDA